MTLTTERPRRSEVTTDRPPAPSPALETRLVLPDVYRVTADQTTVGYIEIVGRVYVGLLGPVYNTSVEVGQHLDLEAALRNLEARCPEVGG